MASALGRNKSVISTWLTNKGRISWQALCEISYVFHIPLADILTCGSDAIAFSVIRALPLSQSRAGRRQRKIAVRHDISHTLAFFDAIEKGHYSAVLTLEAVAARLNTSARELRRILPDKTKALVTTLAYRRSKVKQIKAQQRQQLLEHEVPEAIFRILRRGENLTRRAVSNELSCAGVNVRRSDQPAITKLKLKALETMPPAPFPAIDDRPPISGIT